MLHSIERYYATHNTARSVATDDAGMGRVIGYVMYLNLYEKFRFHREADSQFLDYPAKRIRFTQRDVKASVDKET